MVLSMTGYGQASSLYNGKTIKVELRSLNGKTADLRCKIPPNYKDKEILIRRQVLDGALRGKMEISLTLDSEEGTEEYIINRSLFKKYYRELNELRQELQLNDSDIMQSILRIPNVIMSNEEKISDEEWKVAVSAINAAISSLNEYRADEGKVLAEDLNMRINAILDTLQSIEPYEESRIERIKDRMLKNLNDNTSLDQLDKNRFEQEVIYYLEKLDINEEKVRLKQHCLYFLDELNLPNTLKGKKLSFISQEMGREINTLGAKAQDSDIQKKVIFMKDELEKIKEQIANIV